MAWIASWRDARRSVSYSEHCFATATFCPRLILKEHISSEAFPSIFAGKKGVLAPGSWLGGQMTHGRSNRLMELQLRKN